MDKNSLRSNLRQLKEILFEQLDDLMAEFIKATTGDNNANSQIYHKRFKELRRENRQKIDELFDGSVEIVGTMYEGYLKDYDSALNYFSTESLKLADERLKEAIARMDAVFDGIEIEVSEDSFNSKLNQITAEAKEKVKNTRDALEIKTKAETERFETEAKKITTEFEQKGKVIIEMYTKGEFLPEEN